MKDSVLILQQQNKQNKTTKVYGVVKNNIVQFLCCAQAENQLLLHSQIFMIKDSLKGLN